MFPGVSGFPRGRSFLPAHSDSAPASHRVVPRTTVTRFQPWVPEGAGSPEEAYVALVARLRSEFKQTLGAEEAAVGTGLHWAHLRPLHVLRGFGDAIGGFRRWLMNHHVALGGATTVAPSSLYDALAHALFGPDSGHGPKLRWLAVQHMRLNQGAFLKDAKDAGRTIAAFLEAHKRPSEPGTPATLHALAACLGVVVRVVSYSGNGEVRFAQYPRPEDGGSGSGAAEAPIVHLCAPTTAVSHGVTDTVLYDVLVAVPRTPAAGVRRSAADAGLLPPAAARVAAAAHVSHAGALDAPPAVEADESGTDSDEENDEASAAAVRLARAMGGGLASLDQRAWAATITRDGAEAVLALLDGVKAMLDEYRSDENNQRGGAAARRKRSEALRAVDEAVTDAEKALLKAQEEAYALADAHTVLVVGEEAAGKSSLVNRILLHPLASSATLARINFEMRRSSFDQTLETITRWDEGSSGTLDAGWFSEAAAVNDNNLLAAAEEIDKHKTAPGVCPTGNDDTTTLMCTTVVLAPGLEPRLVLKYKSAAALRELRAHVDEIRKHNWRQIDSPDKGADDASSSEGPDHPLKATTTSALPLDAAESGGESAPAEAGEGADDGPDDEPEDSEYWADYATAVFGVDVHGTSGDEAAMLDSVLPGHVLKVHELSDEDLSLPLAFRELLGTTLTLRFTHTDRDSLVKAVAAELKRRTVGRWSHCGLLESVRLYLPSDNGVSLTLVDVPGYSESLLPFRKKCQDWAFEYGRFSTLVQCIKPRFQHKTIPEQMRENELFVSKVLSPLANEGTNVNFKFLPLYCLDYGITTSLMDSGGSLASLSQAAALAKKLAASGHTASTEFWKIGLRAYLIKTQPKNIPTKKLEAKLAAITNSGIVQPMVVNATPTYFAKVLEGSGHNQQQQAELTKWDNSLAELIAQLTANSRQYSQRVAARTLEALMAAVVPLLRHVAQLQGFRKLEQDAPNVLQALRERITPQYRSSVQRQLLTLLDSKYNENEARHADAVRAVLATTTRQLQEGCQKSSEITERFCKDEFALYNRPHSRQLKPDIRGNSPHSASAGLLKRLLFGTECSRAIVSIADASVGPLRDELFFKTAATGSRAQSTFDAVTETLSHMLKTQLLGSDEATNAKLTSLVTLTEELFCDELAVVLCSRRDEVVGALSVAALTQRLETADDSILARVLRNALAGVDTVKLRTNKRRVEAMANIINKKAAKEVAEELKAHVMSVLQQLQNKFMEKVAEACNKVVLKLQGLDADGLRTLAHENAFERSSRLGMHLCRLTAAVTDAPEVAEWLGCTAASRDERMRLTADLRKEVHLSCAGSPGAARAALPAQPTGAARKIECTRCRIGDFGHGSFSVPNTRGELCLVCFKCYKKTTRDGA